MLKSVLTIGLLSAAKIRHSVTFCKNSLCRFSHEQYVLYKAFSEKAHMDDFLHHGKMRFGNVRSFASQQINLKNLQHCKTQIADPRTDDSEGTGEFITPHGVNVAAIAMTPTYIFCCAGSNVDLDHLRTFGRYIVKISDPLRLANMVKNKLRLINLDVFDEPEWRDVSYDKGVAKFDQFGPQDFEIFQKSPRYAIDKEKRLMFQTTTPELSNLAPRFLCVGATSDFCSPQACC